MVEFPALNAVKRETSLVNWGEVEKLEMAWKMEKMEMRSCATEAKVTQRRISAGGYTNTKYI